MNLTTTAQRLSNVGDTPYPPPSTHCAEQKLQVIKNWNVFIPRPLVTLTCECDRPLPNSVRLLQLHCKTTSIFIRDVDFPVTNRKRQRSTLNTLVYISDIWRFSVCQWYHCVRSHYDSTRVGHKLLFQKLLRPLLYQSCNLCLCACSSICVFRPHSVLRKMFCVWSEEYTYCRPGSAQEMRPKRSENEPRNQVRNLFYNTSYSQTCQASSFRIRSLLD